ncbi:hypothetical protein SAMN05216184_104117 [Georgenia satyanarayanai]|uniref:Uncharacterized protein n=1 Tax=Georgenia satyanarayanai TaxID=860221 RepID=A0A2Y9AAZ4_9MICO|nr:hypothetical protein [Georgenia satyanarayanai]PYG00178.1 hypothetical protein A8987_104117 [Georgenia satyanarayanai]SSA40408.1 hypothetical protein SAMN05216184_104117 [Georgenia satyanarayanai]
MAQQCSATAKSTGQQCARQAIAGGTVCRVHGGATQRARAAAARRVAEQQALAAVTTLGLPRDISPTEALLEEVRWTAGHVQWLRGKVQELEQQPSREVEDSDGELADLGGQHSLVWGVTREKTGGDDRGTTQEAAPSIWYVLYERERKHLVTVASAALKAGVEERRVRLAESQGALVAGVIRRVLDGMLEQLLAAGMAPGMRDVWQESVVEIVPRELRALAAGGGAP